jgi:excisionase family DNA binding protein
MTHRSSNPPGRPGCKARSTATCTLAMRVNVADGRGQRGRGLPRYYAIKTVAEALDVSTRTVRRWIANGDLVAHRIDGVVRISESDLRAFLALHREG